MLKLKQFSKRKISDIDVLNELARSNAFDYIGDSDLLINISSFEVLSPEIIDLISKVGSINIDNFCGLTNEILEKLTNVRFYVNGDSYASFGNMMIGKNQWYTADDMSNILNVFNTIRDSIPKDASELDKFLLVYKSIAMAADYDRSGCVNDEEYIEGNEETTRSLKGVLIDGRAVCRGYALALYNALKYVGVDCKIVDGYALNDPRLGHAFNQVIIDGKAYWVDATWDSSRFKRDIPVEYCLIGDEQFKKDHTPCSHNIWQCNENYNQETVKARLQELPYVDTKKKVSLKDIAKVAYEKAKDSNFRDSSEILSDIEQINNGEITEVIPNKDKGD